MTNLNLSSQALKIGDKIVLLDLWIFPKSIGGIYPLPKKSGGNLVEIKNSIFIKNEKFLDKKYHQNSKYVKKISQICIENHFKYRKLFLN